MKNHTNSTDLVETDEIYRKLINKELGEVKFTKKREKSKHRTCPTCGKGKLVTLMTFDQRGPPAQWQNLFS